MLPVLLVLLLALLVKDSLDNEAHRHGTIALPFCANPIPPGFVSSTVSPLRFHGLASFLTVFFHDHTALQKFALVTSNNRCPRWKFSASRGGFLSDKIGGYRLLLGILTVLSLSLFAVGTLPPLTIEVVLLFLTMGMLGMGNGAVFQLVPQRFPERIGILTGLVGAAGGFGGFLLPSLLGAIKDRTGQYSWGVYLIAAAFLVAALALLEIGTQWQANWHEASVDRAGIFSYRKSFRAPAQEVTE
jgi:NNP family nitrate/nitrite transporter-like MFS transporter